MEECQEVSQRICKMLRFGKDEIQPGQIYNNTERLWDEVEDLKAILDLCWDEDLISVSSLTALSLRKDRRARIEKYMEYSRKCGVLKD